MTLEAKPYGIARECAHILPSGNRCAQFARKHQPFCRAHADVHRRQQNEEVWNVIQSIPEMDLVTLTALLQDTIVNLRAKTMPPLHAETVTAHILTRLESIEGTLEEVLIASE